MKWIARSLGGLAGRDGDAAARSASKGRRDARRWRGTGSMAVTRCPRFPRDMLRAVSAFASRRHAADGRLAGGFEPAASASHTPGRRGRSHARCRYSTPCGALTVENQRVRRAPRSPRDGPGCAAAPRSPRCAHRATRFACRYAAASSMNGSGSEVGRRLLERRERFRHAASAPAAAGLSRRAPPGSSARAPAPPTQRLRLGRLLQRHERLGQVHARARVVVGRLRERDAQLALESRRSARARAAACRSSGECPGDRGRARACAQTRARPSSRLP